jgi:hypothetical protein
VVNERNRIEKGLLMSRLLLLLGFCTLLGCTRTILKDEKRVELTQEAPTYTYTVPEIKHAQNVKVTLSADAPVSVAFGLKKDEGALGTQLTSRNIAGKAMVLLLKTQDAQLEATIPANESAIIIVTREANKKTNVKVNITN